MALQKPNPRDQASKYDNVRQNETEISAVRVTDEPCKKPSVSTEEENDPYEDLQRGLLEGSNQELEAAGLMPKGHRTDDDSADDSERTECVFMDSEEGEEERSPYDCRQNLQMDMGDGDMVTGYRT